MNIVDEITGGRRMRRNRKADWTRRLVQENRLTVDDLMLISRAREIDATKWLQIAAWAKRNRSTYRLAGIASTIAEYAADAWVRSPSVKQAKWGLELARQHEGAATE